MPRNKALRGSQVHERDIRVNCPFLREFFSTLYAVDDTGNEFMTSSSLHKYYVNFVSCKTTHSTSIKLSTSLRRFCMQFKAEAHKAGISQVTVGTKRGYRLGIKKQKRLARECSDTEMQNTERYRKYLDLPKHRREHALNRVFISKLKGYGAVSCRVIRKNEIICEYEGECICEAEALIRDAEYESKGLPVTMFKLSKDLYLDGNRDKEGRELSIEENVGAWLNHSIYNANCRIINVNKSLVIVSNMEIPCSTELFYDYNDRRQGLPIWLKK